MAKEPARGADDNPEWGPDNTRRAADASAQLRVVRATLGLTQAELASMLGVSQATLRNWEQRRFAPDAAAQTLIRLLTEHPREIHAMLASPEDA